MSVRVDSTMTVRRTLAPIQMIPQYRKSEGDGKRRLLTPDEVRMLDNRYCILFIRGARPVMDLKYELMDHPAIRNTMDGGAPPYIHHGTAAPALPGEPLFQSEYNKEKENAA